jgi:hypothetical protein
MVRSSSSFVLVNLDEPLKRPVVSFFNAIGEKASRKLMVSPMITETLAAESLAAARLVAAVAIFEVSFAVAFSHRLLPLSQRAGYYTTKQSRARQGLSNSVIIKSRENEWVAGR